jgi:uncharacterized damage-inducible protein DinB
MKSTPEPLRAHLARALDWEEAHAGVARAVERIPVEHRGSCPAGFEHSPWQLLEHLRLAQKDLLDLCVNPQYAHTLTWPDDYWPQGSAPPDAAAWDRSVAEFRADCERLKQLARDEDVDLFAPVPAGRASQSYLRAILLVIDHNAYHVGQLVAVRRALGIWQG